MTIEQDERATLVDAIEAIPFPDTRCVSNPVAFEQGFNFAISAAVELVRAASTSANVAQGAEQPVYAYVYEYDTAFGLHRQFEPGTYNGSNPKRTVKVYAAPPAQTALTVTPAMVKAAIPWLTGLHHMRNTDAKAHIEEAIKAALTAAQSASGDTK